jgi:hypothetical protein
MRKPLLIATLCFALCSVQAQQLRTPAASPSQTIKQEMGLGTIELSYSRPGIKGRKIFGDLVPYNKVWRTGANGATTLTFSDEVTIGGTKIPAGKYGLLTIPDKNSWTIIITKQTNVTSPAAYKQEEDVVRVQVKPAALKEPVETFTIQFADVKSNSCALQIMWEKTAVTLPISTDVDTKVMAQINEVMSKEEGNKPYFGAAMYYLENGKDLSKALEWFNKAVEQSPKAFWVWHQYANCLAKLGKKDEAVKAANKSIELAKEAKNDDYVALNEKLIKSLK